MHVAVSPTVVRWAIDRSGKSLESLQASVKQLPRWLSGEASPTFPQLERFAAATYVPLGRFFLDEPPTERLPIADFRRIEARGTEPATADLVDTIRLCEARQDWYREYNRELGLSFEFVGSLTTGVAPARAAETMAQALGLRPYRKPAGTSWDAVFSDLIDAVERLGVLVMVSGVVGANTSRRLDYRDFRGFTLADPLAPVIFINGTDSRAATIFTLVHELAHVYLGDSGVSDAERSIDADASHETWCNRVAAELLIPTDELRRAYAASKHAELSDVLDELARFFKVSAIAILLRLRSTGVERFDDFDEVYANELERAVAARDGHDRSGGGNFYNTEGRRVSKRFARAVLADTASGRTAHRDAHRLLGVKTTSTLVELGRRLGTA